MNLKHMIMLWNFLKQLALKSLRPMPTVCKLASRLNMAKGAVSLFSTSNMMLSQELAMYVLNLHDSFPFFWSKTHELDLLKTGY
jgi:hypothetical protein